MEQKYQLQEPGEPLASVILVNWNGAAVLPACLRSLKAQTYTNWELIFVDNASCDESVRLAIQYFPGCKLIRLETNEGFVAGNNLGLRHADGKYVILLNNDTQVQENFIQCLVSEAEKDPMVASVGCRIKQFDGSMKYGPVFVVEGGIVYRKRISDLLVSSQETYPNHKASVAANCGCAVLFRRSVLEKVGLFDPIFRSNWEDHDLGLRINLAGYSVIYTPDTTVLHFGGHTEGSVLKLGRLSQVVRNTLITYYKNFEFPKVFFKMPIALLLSAGDGANEWARGAASRGTPLVLVSGIAIGTCRFLADLRMVQKKRLTTQRVRTITDKELLSKTAPGIADRRSGHIGIGQPRKV